MVKTDCFAYLERYSPEHRTKGQCLALNALYCQSEECKFYKTARQACKECTYSDCRGCPNPLATEENKKL